MTTEKYRKNWVNRIYNKLDSSIVDHIATLYSHGVSNDMILGLLNISDGSLNQATRFLGACKKNPDNDKNKVVCPTIKGPITDPALLETIYEVMKKFGTYDNLHIPRRIAGQQFAHVSVETIRAKTSEELERLTYRDKIYAKVCEMRRYIRKHKIEGLDKYTQDLLDLTRGIDSK